MKSMSVDVKKSKKNSTEYGLLFLLLTAAVAVIFNAFLFRGYPFKWTFSSDHIFQMNQFYTEAGRLLKEAVKTHSLSFYSWNSFLGGNFYGSKVYYLTGDIFLPLLLLFDSATDFLLLETIICIYIAAFSMNAFLKRFGIGKSIVSISFSLIYSLGGGFLIMMCFPMFLRFYAFLPLLFLGVEKYLQDHKSLLFAMSVCILFLQNYYLMFPVTLFLPVYFIFSYSLKEDHFRLNECLKCALRLIISYFIGFLISMAVLFPGILFILNSDRLSYNELRGMMTWPLKTWISLFYYSFLPVMNILTENPFAVSFEIDNSLAAYFYSLDISSLGCLGLISFFLNKNNSKRRTYGIVLLLLLSANMFLPLNSLNHMLTTPTMRFSFILLFFMILTGAKGLDTCEDLKAGSIVFCIAFVSVSGLCFLLKLFDLHQKILLLLLVVVTVLCLMEGFFYKKLPALCLLTVYGEIVLLATYCISFKALFKYDDPYSEVAFEEIAEKDDDLFYRYSIDYRDMPPVESILNLNTSLLYDYSGLCTYDSTYENALDDFIGWTASTAGNQHIINITDPKLYKMLSVKYVAVSDEGKLDNINEYEYAFDLGALKVYRMKEYNSLGHSYSSLISEKDIGDLSSFDWNETLIVEEELMDQLRCSKDSEKKQLTLSYREGNSFGGDITVDEKQVLLISLPFDEGWKIRDNGNFTKLYDVDGGFIGLVLEKGNHHIEAVYVPSGFKSGLCLSASGIAAFVLMAIYEKKHAVR